MATQPTASHNPAVRSSGKVGRNRFSMTPAMAEACRLVKTLGLVPSFRNLYIVELAIIAESHFQSISLQRATDHIIECARICCGELHQCIDYFWFEDCCWRNPKLSFKHQDDLRMRERAAQR